MVFEKLKFKITVYFVTCVHKSILNIASTKLWHKNINIKKDRDAFDLKIKKSGAVFLRFDSFYSLILADNIIIYLLFIIIYDDLLKYVAVTGQFLQ